MFFLCIKSSSLRLILEQKQNTNLKVDFKKSLSFDENEIIFGSDKAIIIYRSYSPSDFELKENTLYIKVSKILEDIADVEEFDLEPVLNIRHDSTRASTGGLRATVQPKNKLYSDDQLTGNKIELSYNDIIS